MQIKLPQNIEEVGKKIGLHKLNQERSPVLLDDWNTNAGLPAILWQEIENLLACLKNEGKS